jgi:hypothetical protein
MAASTSAIVAQTRIDPGFNLFSVEQDQEIGRQSADEVERDLPILHDRSIEAFVNAIGKRLAAVAPGADYPYQFKVVNVSDINAFALPGGYLYLNRGLIEAAENEGQLAGVMAHEMAHVALRHGTNQASKAYVGQAGLSLLAGLIRKDDHSTDDMIAAAGGFGLNSVFLKFSRGAEEKADITGAQMMAEAGYDPADMVDFFGILAEAQDHDPGKVEQFFSSHPAPTDRSARIDDEIALLTVKTIRPVGGFTKVHSELSRMRPAASMQQLAEGQTQPSRAPRPVGNDRSIPEIGVEAPSSGFRVFAQRDGLFQIDYPDNWQVFEADRGFGVTLAPDKGYLDVGGQERDLISGVIVNNYDPFENDSIDRFGDDDGPIEGNSSLIRATNDLVDQILRINPNLQIVRDSERRDRIDRSPSLSIILSGRSEITRKEERITVFTRESADNQIVYALFVAPQSEYARLNETFNRMISSLQVSDESNYDSSAGSFIDTSAPGSASETVPTGTVLKVRFDETLSSDSSQAGDRFRATVVESVRVNGRIAIPVGSTIAGRVVDAQPSKRFGGRAQMNLEFTSLTVESGIETPISASFHGQGESQTRQDAVTIGGATAGGAVVGKVLGDDSEDTALGALVGGAIGTAIAARNRGEEVTLPEGITVEIHLDAAVALR